MKFYNVFNVNTSTTVLEWLSDNLNLKKVRIMVKMNHDNTVGILEIDEKLSSADKSKILAKYPELEGKEV